MSPGQQWQGHPGVYAAAGAYKRDAETAPQPCPRREPENLDFTKGDGGPLCHWPPPSGVVLSPGRVLPPHLPRTLSRQHRVPWWRRGARLKVKFSGSCFLSLKSHTSSSLRSVHSEGEDCACRVQGFFPTELETESPTRPSGNQRLTGEKGEVRFLPEIEVRDMGGIQRFMGSILVLTGPMREAVGKYHSPV